MKQWKGIEAQCGRGRRGCCFLHNRDSLLASGILEQTQSSGWRTFQNKRRGSTDSLTEGILNVFWGTIRRSMRAEQGVRGQKGSRTWGQRPPEPADEVHGLSRQGHGTGGAGVWHLLRVASLNSIWERLCQQRVFHAGSESRQSACNAGDTGLIPGSGWSPGIENGKPLQYSCLEKSHGQRSLVGYSPWGRKEFDMTEQLTLSFIFFFFMSVKAIT